MNKKKFRFNAIDVLILLIITAVVFVLLYVFVFTDDSTEQPDVVYQNIQYVVEVNNLDEQYEEMITKGQSVQDAVERRSIGVVSGVQTVPYEKITFDKNNGEEKVSSVEGKISMKITIDAQAVETDRDFSVDGCVIKVGKQYSLMLPEMYAVGYCIEIIEKQ